MFEYTMNLVLVFAHCYTHMYTAIILSAYLPYSNFDNSIAGQLNSLLHKLFNRY